MGIIDTLRSWTFGVSDGFQGLDLKRDVIQTSSRSSMPKAPALDTSLVSLLRYARQSEIVFACIEKKCQSACDAELVVERRNSDGEWERIDMHPLVALLNKPNPYDDGESFRRSWIASENFADVFYAEIVRNGAGQPVALYPLDSTRVTPQYRAAEKGWVLDYYLYQTDGYEVRFQPEELMIRRRHSLGSVYAGVSAVAMALGSIDADLAATEYRRAFFNNDGTPSGVLKITGRNFSEDEMQAIQQKWTQNYSRGGKNRGRVAVLDERADYQTIGASLNELASDILTSIDESRICMVFGVPPILIGAYVGLLHVNQRASVREAQQDFWMNTMSPELKSIRSFLTWNLLPMFESIESIKAGKIRVSWDISKVEALQEDVDDLHKRITETYKGGIITLNEARAKIGYDAVEGEEGDVFYQPKPQFGQSGEEPKQLNPQPETKEENIIDAEIIESKPQCGNCERLHCPHSHEVFSVKGYCAKCRPDYHDEHNRQMALQGELAEKFTAATGNDPLEDWLGFEKFADNLEKKTFEYGGLTLSREPTEIEKLLDLKAMVDASVSDKENLSKVLLSLRESLIEEAVKSFFDLPDDELFQLTLTPPVQIYKRVRKIIVNAFSRGVDQVLSELRKQGVTGSFDIEHDPEQQEKITDLTVSRIVNEIQTRAINQVATLGVLGVAANEIKEQLGQKLRDQSDSWINGYSQSAVNTATQRGRNDTIDATSEYWKHLEYSAILDNLVCDTCEEWDGTEAQSVDDLPDTPNPECSGQDRCRCFIIAVAV